MPMTTTEDSEDAPHEPPEGFLKPGYITYRGRDKLWQKIQERREDQDREQAKAGA